MEEMMMVMMKIRSHETPSKSYKNTNTNTNILVPIINTTTRPTWKLYENPYYTSSHHNNQDHLLEPSTTDHHQIHKLHLPISSKKTAASFFDLTFIKPLMEPDRVDAETTRPRLSELRSELESERKARRKMESLNKRLEKEVREERRGREAVERVCEELAREISSQKDEIGRMRREIEDERKMLRTAEIIREERVQMKLAEAKVLLEEKLSEMETVNRNRNRNGNEEKKYQESNSNPNPNSNSNSKFNSVNSMVERKTSLESENPHIKRGIKGFVEFPKVVRAIGCRSSKHLGSKLECQKAQLKILLKHKGSVRFNGLITR